MTADFNPPPFSTDPVEHMKAIDHGAKWLDWITKALDTAVDNLDQAEAIWDELYDLTADSLKQEMEDEGRKGDPAAHWIESRARKENRVAYQNLRRAKRQVEKLEKQIRSVSAAMNGRQSDLSALRNEARVPQQAPEWARHRRAAA